MLMGVSFTGSADVQSASLATYDQRTLKAGSSLSAVQGDSSGETYYQDKAAQLVWVKLQGGLKPNPYWAPDVNSDDQMYHPMILTIK